MAKSQVQCKLSTNEKPSSIIPESFRPIAIGSKIQGNPCFLTGHQSHVFEENMTGIDIDVQNIDIIGEPQYIIEEHI